MCEPFGSDLVHTKFEVTVFFGSPSATRQSPLQVSRARPRQKFYAGSYHTHGETHGFAPSPRDKFAIIVCNLYLKEQCRETP